MSKQIKISRILSGLFILIILNLFVSCKKDPNPPSGTTYDVSMQNSKFTPATITVAVNSTVKWTNNDSYNHNVKSNDGTFQSPTLAGGATYTHTFTTAGTYNYVCTFHSGMTGTVVVQ